MEVPRKDWLLGFRGMDRWTAAMGQVKGSTIGRTEAPGKNGGRSLRRAR
jgi:hypothetical protein